MKNINLRVDKTQCLSARRTQARRGFSLVELMVVIIIIGLLATVATLSVRGYLIRSKQAIAKLEISKIIQALDSFYAQFDRYPTTTEGIEILSAKSNEFLTKEPRNPWGHAYEYLSPSGSDPYEIICYGADHREGGSGADLDITSKLLARDAKP